MVTRPIGPWLAALLISPVYRLRAGVSVAWGQRSTQIESMNAGVSEGRWIRDSFLNCLAGSAYGSDSYSHPFIAWLPRIGGV